MDNEQGMVLWQSRQRIHYWEWSEGFDNYLISFLGINTEILSDFLEDLSGGKFTGSVPGEKLPSMEEEYQIRTVEIYLGSENTTSTTKFYWKDWSNEEKSTMKLKAPYNTRKFEFGKDKS